MLNTKNRHSKGFTLMELLITLSLFSAIMGFLMSTFFQFQNQSDRYESILQLRQEIRILERIIRNDLQTIVYLDEFAKDPQQEYDGRKTGVLGEDGNMGDHDRDSIHMHINNSSKFHRGLAANLDPEIHEVSYYLEEGEEENLKFKRREEFYIDTDITEGDRSIIHTLSDHVISFDVKYYKGTSEEPEDDWDSSEYEESKKAEDKLPSGLIVTLILENEKGEQLKSEMQVNIRPNMGNGISWQ